MKVLNRWYYRWLNASTLDPHAVRELNTTREKWRTIANIKTHNGVVFEACIEAGIGIKKGGGGYNDPPKTIDSEEAYVKKEYAELNIECMRFKWPDLMVSLDKMKASTMGTQKKQYKLIVDRPNNCGECLSMQGHGACL